MAQGVVAYELGAHNKSAWQKKNINIQQLWEYVEYIYSWVAPSHS